LLDPKLLREPHDVGHIEVFGLRRLFHADPPGHRERQAGDAAAIVEDARHLDVVAGG
jgi:hypothetical protein